jgi:hypothetical protein
VNCFNHNGRAAVGICGVCQKAICRECVGSAAPRLVCTACGSSSALASGVLSGVAWRGYGYEYRSPITIGGWPLLHVCSGIDPVTLRPRIAKGVVAIGNIAIGAFAVGGVACGLVALGGASLGLLLAAGGAAIGTGLSIGGLAIGSVAAGGAAVGLMHAFGGAAFGPSAIDATRCDETARQFLARWTSLPPGCR